MQSGSSPSIAPATPLDMPIAKASQPVLDGSTLQVVAPPAQARRPDPSPDQRSNPRPDRHTLAQGLFLLFLWAAIYLAALAGTPVLDDADATHAQAAAAMLQTGDFVTLHVNGIRYLEKPPLPYWITAVSLRLFGRNSSAVHLPLALAVLALALLAWHWGRRAFDQPSASPYPAGDPHRRASDTTGFYAALFVLTSAGVFLFTRVFIPDALLSVFLALTLYAALRALEPGSHARTWAALFWLTLAAGVLTKGLIALVFPLGALALYLPLSGELRRWRRLHPLLGTALFFAVAAPWHILAGLRNRGGADGHGFFWFYFINEHVLRFLGRRYPPDYNKLPAALYWSLHLVWLFPSSFFAPVALRAAWRRRQQWIPVRASSPRAAGYVPKYTRNPSSEHTFGQRSALLLALFSSLVLLFFSLSTNQEYYTFPVYLPLLLLLAAVMVREENSSCQNGTPDAGRLLLGCQWALTAVCLLAAVALAVGLWSSRHLPAAPDVGDLIARRGVGDYTLSMSHFFDLTDASFSALRLPATLACIALAGGSVMALFLRLRRRHGAATITFALVSAVFLIAAHLALIRFSSLLSSERFALSIKELQANHAIGPDTQIMLYGDQALGSSIPFYLGRQVDLVDGRSTSMIFGSTFPDAPKLFLTPQQLRAAWGVGPRKVLFVPEEHRDDVDHLLGKDQILLGESAGKALLTDRPLTRGDVDSTAPSPRQ